MQKMNPQRLFIGCSLALVVTAMTLAIRAGILSQLNRELGLSDTELGWINGMAFLGFPIATMTGGLLYNLLGAKRLMLMAFVGHLVGLVLTISADGFWLLLSSSFLIGFANGSVEAACNPMIADIYHKNKTTMLNRFHVWFPGGILIGALTSYFMTRWGMAWQLQIAVMILPTLVYGYLLLRQPLPASNHIETDTRTNLRGLLSPLYLFLVLCMTLTATTELGTQQWIERILGASGASPMLIMAMMTGLMAVGRYFAGPLVHRFNPVGVLLGSSIAAVAGLYTLSIATGATVYVGAIIFALGVTYYWPTMVGFVAEYTPQTGALGMSLLGGAGMFAVSLWNPVIGHWIDSARMEAEAQQLTGAAAELAAGQAALLHLAAFPAVLVIAFGALTLVLRRQKNAAQLALS
ncbi:MFS transporter [Simiduia curdlanivorans]|uniref:MFS transporter n=2 Tax=Simiduia curdlanivorans TaxID=1492769 RepID=A0ABV8V0A4_9GAMM